MLKDFLVVVLCSDHLKDGSCLEYVLGNLPYIY